MLKINDNEIMINDIDRKIKLITLGKEKEVVRTTEIEDITANFI